MKKIISITFISTIEIFFMKYWTLCHGFIQPLRFSEKQSEIALLGDIHNDTYIPFILIRFFHNKPVIFAFDILHKYVYYFDVRFLISLTSFIGLGGIILGFWYLLKLKQKKIKYFSIVFILSIPIFEMFLTSSVSFIFSIAILFLPLFALSLLGFLKFINSRKDYLPSFIVLILLIVSIWWFLVFPDTAPTFCAR